LWRFHAVSIYRWSHGSWIIGMQMANQDLAEIDSLDIVAEGLKAQSISNKSLADKTFSVAPFYFPITPDLALVPKLGIWQSLFASGPTAWTFSIFAGWHFLTQCLVRANAVVLLNPTSCSMLLALKSIGRWPGGFRLKQPVHLFMGSILLRMSGPDKLHPDPQSCPPGAQTRQPCRSRRGERSAVISSDDLGQPITFEKLRKYGLCWPPALIRQQAYDQNISAKLIAYRQRFYPLSVTGSKPTLEIRRPHAVRRLRYSQGWQSKPTCFTRATTAPLNQLQTLQPSSNGDGRRRLSILTQQTGLNLLRTPMPMSLTRSRNSLNPLAPHLQGHSVRPTRMIIQVPPATLAKTAQPFVRGFSTDAEVPAPTSYRPFALKQCFDQPPPLPNNRCVFPRHIRGNPPKL
jgi:hypothetical protein